MSQVVPEGYRLKANGTLVPESQVKEIDALRDDLVTSLVEKAKQVQQGLAEFKVEAMSQIRDFVDLSAEEYDVKYGGTKGNVSLLSFDGKYKLMRAVGEHRVFDERIQAAKAKIDECIHRWAEGSNDNIKALVEHAFRVNKQGHIDLNSVLNLRSLNIDDPDWNEAMEAIADSVQVTGTSSYLRIYERQENGQYKQFPLDISKV
ncbi:DUF3164 family protein [Vibrio europaeus]|uniref:DUF3164 family protein n=1 Tax=Vibrio europaeus TaxID=300876 RepID=UPI00233F6129|nr:DUF3164 family protein [Vibrio europaeus]MDC5753833.1 DUF3164 family protein [Vibrio europaeus]MDC5776745.1 DUF3164 family protein [Vibrio europaeus]MDC5796761.1 DUF3164 family protein [Vibrio europaeus]MDC5801758.1 DUF3164 family protein [Vibrio europaeus]MDC5815731.1 DUF3164 family protein [Vibrio europaeus]